MVYPKKPDRVRAAGIVIHDGALLVMFRRKNGREYYTFPGGSVEEGETPQEAVAREIEEETTISVDVGDIVYELHREGEKARGAFSPRELFYRCTYKSGVPMLGSDSIERALSDTEENYFEPQWTKISELKDISLLPAEVARRLLHDLVHGFASTPIILNGARIQDGKT